MHGKRDGDDAKTPRDALQPVLKDVMLAVTQANKLSLVAAFEQTLTPIYERLQQIENEIRSLRLLLGQRPNK